MKRIKNLHQSLIAACNLLERELASEITGRSAIDCDMFRSNLLGEHLVPVTQLLQQEYSPVEI